MKRLALMASVLVLGTMSAAHAETVTEQVIFTTPQISPLEAFNQMDLDNNWEVNTIEYDWAYDHYPEVRGYTFSGLDMSGNGLVTREEAQTVSPAIASAEKTTIRTIIKDPVIVQRPVASSSTMSYDMVEPAAGGMNMDSDVDSSYVHTNTRTTTIRY